MVNACTVDQHREYHEHVTLLVFHQRGKASAQQARYETPCSRGNFGTLPFRRAHLAFATMLLSHHGLFTHHMLPPGRIHPRPHHSPHPSSSSSSSIRCRAAAVSVSCQAGVKKSKKPSAKRSGGFSRRSKGFGGKQQEDWESQLLPPYRVYYKQGYKPPRFQGTLKPVVLEGEEGCSSHREVSAGP